MPVLRAILVDRHCIGCGKTPDEIGEYITAAHDAETTPDQFVVMFEGTYNSENGHFTCTECYIKMGMPTSPSGWVAP